MKNKIHLLYEKLNLFDSLDKYDSMSLKEISEILGEDAILIINDYENSQIQYIESDEKYKQRLLKLIVNDNDKNARDIYLKYFGKMP